jgi:hypothetical protein
MKHVPWYLLAALAAGTATAQAPARPDPADPAVRVAPPVYRSAFEGYRKLEDAPRADWRESNDETARIGGHIGILREGAAREKQAQGERK